MCGPNLPYKVKLDFYSAFLSFHTRLQDTTLPGTETSKAFESGRFFYRLFAKIDFISSSCHAINKIFKEDSAPFILVLLQSLLVRIFVFVYLERTEK